MSAACSLGVTLPQPKWSGNIRDTDTTIFFFEIPTPNKWYPFFLNCAGQISLGFPNLLVKSQITKQFSFLGLNGGTGTQKWI